MVKQTNKQISQSKGKQTRLSDRSLMLIRMFAGEMQAQKARNYTDDRAVLELFEQCRPDLIARLDALESSNGQ